MQKTILVIALTLCLCSCKKDDANPVDTPVVQEQVSEYFPMAIGNYWVYQMYEADSSLTFTPLDVLDSVYVEKDTLIRGLAFRKISSSAWWSKLLRDSSGFLVNEFGIKIFTNRAYALPLIGVYYPVNLTQFYLTRSMKDGDSVSIVPAGQFLAKYVIGSLTDEANPSPSLRGRKIFEAYAKGVGLVCERNVWVFGGGYIERKLLRYKVSGNY